MFYMDFLKEYKLIKEEIIKTRRTIHANPELGFEEFKTSQTIKNILDKYNISYTDKISKTGICATIGCKTDKVLLIRADMDALPIEEKTGLEFSSQTKGIMHACGHDVHVASALATAIVLKKNEETLNGTVKIVFQPAEETTGGAEPMIAEGVMSSPKVTAAICGHVNGNFETGTFKVKSGPIMASPDDFSVKFIGKSTHGAEPENGISPIAPACEFVTEVNKLSHSLCKGTPNVLSVCTVCSLGGVNTIPDCAEVLGTFRSFDQNSRVMACQALEECAKRISDNHGTKIEYNYNYLYPPVINHEAMTEGFIKTATDLYGSESVEILRKPFMTGDDFSYFSNEVPGVYFWYGAKKDIACSLHSSEFDINEDAIEVCANIFTNFALDYLG